MSIHNLNHKLEQLKNKLDKSGIKILSSDELSNQVKQIDLERQKDFLKIKQQNQVSKNSSSKRYRNLFIEDIQPKSDQESLHKQCLSLSKGGLANLILTGSIGSGKTMFLNGVVNSLNRDGVTSKITTLTNMLLEIKSNISNSMADYRDDLNRYSSYHFLVIDEIGVNSLTEKDREIINMIINNRYENELSTAIISNCSIVHVKSILGDRVIDRLRDGESRHVEISIPSLRGEPAS